MSASALSRLSASSLSERPDLSSAQSEVDSLVRGSLDRGFDWKSVGSLILAQGFAYRFARLGVMSLGKEALATPLRYASYVVGTGAEAATYELSLRGLTTLSQPSALNSPSLLKWQGPQGLGHGFFSSFINFSAIKGFGRTAQGQNLIFRHGAQDLGMVAGQNLAFLAGLGEKPEGSLAEQVSRAEALNWEIGAAVSLGHFLAGGKIQAVETGIDISLRSRDVGANLVFARDLEMGVRGNGRTQGSPLQGRLNFGPEPLPADGPSLVPSATEPIADLVRKPMAMSILGDGGTKPIGDFPFVAEKVIKQGANPLVIKLYSQKPIENVDQVAAELGSHFFALLTSKKRDRGTVPLQGPLATLLKYDLLLRAIVLGPIHQAAFHFDLDRREILAFRIVKSGVQIDLRPVPSLAELELFKKLDRPLRTLLSTRAVNRLQSIEVEYLGELVQKSRSEIKRIYKLGSFTLREIEEALAREGLSLGMKVDWKRPVT